MTRGKQWARCIALVVALWAAWLVASGCSLILAFHAMTLAGLNSAIAISLVVIGALTALGIDMYQASKNAKEFYKEAEESPKKYQRDERLSAELGVAVYRHAGRDIAEANSLYSKPYIIVYPEGYSEEELRAIAYHEYSHIKRRSVIPKGAAKGAAKLSTFVVALLLALVANIGEYVHLYYSGKYDFLYDINFYISHVAIAAASLVLARDVVYPLIIKIEIIKKVDIVTIFLLSSIISFVALVLIFAELSFLLPSPQIGLSDALSSVLSVFGAYLALWLAGHFSELLADAEAALAVGPGPVISALVKTREIVREKEEKLKRELEVSDAPFASVFYRVIKLLDTHPPVSLRIWLLRLCAK